MISGHPFRFVAAVAPARWCSTWPRAPECFDPAWWERARWPGDGGSVMTGTPRCATDIHDDSWWFMMIHDDSWWFMMIHDDSWCSDILRCKSFSTAFWATSRWFCILLWSLHMAPWLWGPRLAGGPWHVAEVRRSHPYTPGTNWCSNDQTPPSHDRKWTHIWNHQSSSCFFKPMVVGEISQVILWTPFWFSAHSFSVPWVPSPQRRSTQPSRWRTSWVLAARTSPSPAESHTVTIRDVCCKVGSLTMGAPKKGHPNGGTYDKPWFLLGYPIPRQT